MKIITSFLAILVLGLSTQSMLMYDRLDPQRTSKKSCSKVCSKKEEKKKAKKGCTDYCNPFMGCSGCLYTMTNILEFSLIVSKDISVKGGRITKKDLQKYNADCWHPPRNC